ncbi:MAG TPA: class I SAM-dependent methyltransferase [Arenibaculum sp.]|nr:class I SAM-dependent methyltransferase [Arenibaculum sp.]
MTEVATCPSCGAPGLEPFHRVAGAPVHSVTLIPSRSAARALATGIISLGLCGRCGFISNMAFDAGLQDYSRDYESSQIHSGVFSAFHRELAGDLVSRHGLHGRSVIEIGCGQGEFLRLLCDLGAGRGVGFDPAYDGERQDLPESVTVVKDYFSERYADVEADFICCKMTLEHIPDTGGFLRIVRRALGDRRNATVFFQVPHAGRILDEVAFWDVYYEHCS